MFIIIVSIIIIYVVYTTESNVEKRIENFNIYNDILKLLVCQINIDAFETLPDAEEDTKYKDAKKELEKIEKQRGGSYHQIAYYVADENGNFVREVMLGEGRGIKSIQNDLDKTVVAIESEIASYKATKGTPQEKKHVDNLKKLHPIKKKLESELEMAVSGLYKDAELKIED